jgi:hypothetical protein
LHKWKKHIKQVFNNCKVIGYTDGSIKRPNEHTDPEGACNWDRNDSWAQQVIIQNITSLQMNHVGSKATAEAMYSALSVTHENKAHGAVHYIQCLLHGTKASKGDNTVKHLNTLKVYLDHINKFPHSDFHITDTRFKSITSGSLPSNWQTFVEPYNGNANDLNDPDPKRHMSMDSLIGLICEEVLMHPSNYILKSYNAPLEGECWDVQVKGPVQ